MLFESPNSINPAVFSYTTTNGVPQIQIPVKNHGIIEANTVEHDLHNGLIPVSATTVKCNTSSITNTSSTTQTLSNGGNSGRSTPNNADMAPGKLFVGGLSWQTSSEKLREYFGMFGTVTDVLIMKDPITQEPDAVEKVLKVPIHTLDGKKIDPKHATPKNRPKAANKTKKIFVGGVSQDTSVEEVKAYFSQFGKVEEAVMLMDQTTKRHRGFGFITLADEDVVDRICEIHFHTIKNKKVECKKAQPKETVSPATQMQLQKRLLLNGLGLRMPTTTAVVGNHHHHHHATNVVPTTLTAYPLNVAAQAAQAAGMVPNHHLTNAGLAAAAAASNNGGKLIATYPSSFHALRYTPYPMAPTMPTAAAVSQLSAQTANQQQQNPQLTAATNPYPGYNLTSVDMSGFNGIDWSSMYGMYV
ncbi:RNA-binding protein Musashi homolog 2 isoform X2 [Chironomus tepperi]|uniref:RNA-binding protein Musashi homolog 2 isoform X2 n=1 Tax=Chironomus tepperi TaxID=113505 RepID=UPI00391F78A3